MTLSAGTRLGPYEILAPVGVGGMGEVYKACDTRLDRIVAIKVSQSEFSERFARESSAIASLNHPNICHLYDVGPSYLVMEYVDGAPIAPGGGFRKVLDAAVQMAAGLAAAHAAGIVHRDLKPDNILVSSDGRLKILDFGLAKLAIKEQTAELTQTVAAVVTNPGTVLGTVSYMSPEQARGLKVDPRSDQFSFGLIVYELATGVRAFARDSAAQTMSAIIEAEPDYTLLAGTPAPFRWIVERCLAKDPRERYESTADLYRDLEQLKRRQSELSGTGTVAAAAPQPASRRPRWLTAVAAVTSAIVCGIAGWSLARTTGVVKPVRYTITPIAVGAAAATTPAWSRDGKVLAYSQEAGGYYQIFIRRLDQRSEAPAQLTTFDRDCLFPFWHPSGDRIYFLSGGSLWAVGAAGGPPQRLIENVSSADISPDDGTIAFLRTNSGQGRSPRGPAAPNGGELWTATPDGANQTRQQEVPLDVARVRFSPDGRTLAFTVGNKRDVLLVDVPFRKGAFPDRTVAFHLPDDTWVYDIAWLPDSRHLIATLGTSYSMFSLVRADLRDGSVEPIGQSELLRTSPAVSADGSRIAYTTLTLNWDILQVDLQTRTMSPLVASARYDGWPAWTPDGDHLVFTTNRTGRAEIWWKSLAEGWERPLIVPADFDDPSTRMLTQPSVSPNGRALAYLRYSARGVGIFLSPLSGGKPTALNASAQAREDLPVWSPDGDWIAFFSQGEILKVRPGADAAPVLVRDDAVDGAKWSRTNRILYLSDAGLTITDPDGRAPQIVSKEPVLVWDWSADGSQIYAIREAAHRRMELVTIDPASGDTRIVMDLGRVPVSPEPIGYLDTIRQLAIAPDGKRAVFAYLQPDSQIWMMEQVKQ